MRAPRLAMTLAAVLLLAGCANTVSGTGMKGPGASPPPTSPSAPTPTTSAPTSDVANLLSPIPAGADPWMDKWGRNEHPTAQEFVANVYDGSGRSYQLSVLKAEGLLDIAHRAWTAANDAQLDVVLLRFRTSSGATQRFGLVTTAAQGPTVRTMAIPGQPSSQAIAYVDRKLDKNGFAFARIYADVGSQNVVMQAYFSSPKKLITAQMYSWTATQLAKLQ
jgi:hypothetical protein